MRRCGRTSEERSGLNQPTNPLDSDFSIRIGRKAMTLGGDSSKAAIARSSAIQVWID